MTANYSDYGQLNSCFPPQNGSINYFFAIYSACKSVIYPFIFFCNSYLVSIRNPSNFTASVSIFHNKKSLLRLLNTFLIRLIHYIYVRSNKLH